MFSLIDTGHAVEQRLEEALAQVGLSLAKFGALTHLVEAGEPISLSECAAKMTCVRSNITQLVTGSKADGLAKRRRRSERPPRGQGGGDSARLGRQAAGAKGNGESAERAFQDPERHRSRRAAACACNHQIAIFFSQNDTYMKNTVENSFPFITRETPMKNILFVSSSPNGWNSYSHNSRAIRRRSESASPRREGGLCATWRKSPCRMSTRPSPPAGRCRLKKRSPAEAEALALSDILLAELEAADVLVLAVPMHNFGVPSTLKAWIDHVVRPGRAFSYSERVPKDSSRARGGRRRRARRRLLRRTGAAISIPGALPARRPRVHRNHQRSRRARSKHGHGRASAQERRGVRKSAIGKACARIPRNSTALLTQRCQEPWLRLGRRSAMTTFRFCLKNGLYLPRFSCCRAP